MLRSRTISLLTGLLSLTPLAEGVAEDSPVTQRSMIEIRDPSADLSNIARTALWVTADNGRSWRQHASETLTPATVAAPTFRFSPDADGTYGFALVRAFRDGTNQPPPVPGEPLAPSNQITFDRTPPAIITWEATPGETTPVGIRVGLRWEVSDPHPGPDPVSIQLRRSASAEWEDLARVTAAGASDILIPANGSLRLQTVDAVGNRGHSEIWAAPTSDPDAGASELAAAVAELPAIDSQDETPETEPSTPLATGPSEAAGDSEDAGDSATQNQGTAPSQSESTAEAPATPQEPAMPAIPADLDRSLLVILDDAPPAPAPTAEAAADDATHSITDLPPGVLIGAHADRALSAARQAAAAQKYSHAEDLYQRLADSTRASDAWPEYLALLQHQGLLSRAANRVAQVPPEATSDRWFLAVARLQLERGDGFAAERALSRVSPGGDNQRLVHLLSAQALLLQDAPRTAAARSLLRHLAQDRDLIGRAAHVLLQRY